MDRRKEMQRKKIEKKGRWRKRRKKGWKKRENVECFVTKE